MLFRIISSVTLVAFVTACATNPVATVPGKVRVEYTRYFPGGGALKEIPSEVTIVKRETTARNVAAQVGLNVLALFAGGAGFQTFSKDDLKGDEIDDLSNRVNIQNPVASQFVASLQSRVDAAMQTHPVWRASNYGKSLFVAGGSSRLLYDTLAGSDDEYFRLKIELVVYKRKESYTLFTSSFVTISCSDNSPELLTRTQWAGNEYALVKTSLDAMLTACENKVVEKLPDLLNG